MHYSLSSVPWPDLALLFTIALTFAVRFWVIRSLDAPMWGDSYQHTVIAQLLADNGGLFDSWQPYAEMTTFTYHFGFHGLVAAFHWITRLPMHQAVLWTGQILNGMAVIFLFPLALRVSRNPWAGVAAVLIAGLLAPMPMYYVNWGRYTQLAGQAILPAAITLSWAILEAKNVNWRALIAAWLALGGLALTHYRVLIFALFFFVAFTIFQIKTIGWRALIIRVFWLGLGSGVLFLPWLIHTFAGKYLHTLARQITTPASQISAFTQGYNSIGDIFRFLPPLLWLALPIALGWGLWRRQKDFALVASWWFLIFLAANPEWFNLPGTGSISNFAVFIAAYIPSSLLVGAAAGWSIEELEANLKKLAEPRNSLGRALIVLPLLCCLFAIVLGLWGSNLRRYDVRPDIHAMVTQPDIRATEWIQANTPKDSRFLINSFFAYGGAAIVGSDGGWWLPLLADRRTTVPPLNYLAEQGPAPNYQASVNALSAAIADKGIQDPNVQSMLHERGVTHVFLGQRQGSINSPAPLLYPESLLTSPHFRLVYQQDRVWIFELTP